MPSYGLILTPVSASADPRERRPCVAYMLAPVLTRHRPYEVGECVRADNSSPQIRVWKQSLGVRGAHEPIETSGFSARDSLSERRQTVVAPPLVVDFGVGPRIRFDYQTVGKQPFL